MFPIPPTPSKEEILTLREATLKKLNDDGSIAALDQRDITRFKTDDDYLRRFLMHHDNDQKLALDMAIDTFKWRKEYNVNDITENTIDKTLCDKKVLFIHNRDVDGCKLLIFSVCHHNKDSADAEKTKELLIYWIERLEREEKGKWITVFFDMRDSGYKNMDMVFIQYMINLFKCYYPWILNYIIVYEMPWLLNAMWKIIKGWLPPKSIEKIKFVDKKSIQTYIPADQCLVGWGGTDNYVFQFEPEKKEKKFVQPLLNGDVDGKKVHFAEGSGSTPSETTPEMDYPNHGSVLEYTKFQVDPAEELVFNNNRIGTRASIVFTNNSPNKFAFKIKTTSPQKYRVSPSVGTIEPKGTREVIVTVSDQLAPSLLVRDKFLVIAIPTVHEDSFTQQDFAETLKMTNKLDVFEVRLRVGLVSYESEESAASSASAPAPVSPVLMAKLDQLMTRQTVIEEQLGSLRRLLYVIFLLMVAILFVFVITTSNLTSSLLAHSRASSHPHEL